MPLLPTVLLLYGLKACFHLFRVTPEKFFGGNDIQHTLRAPGPPATNGLAERCVREFKDKLSNIGDAGESVQTKLDRFLLTYRATPTLFGKSSCEILVNKTQN